MLTFYEVGSPACYSETYCDLSLGMEKSFRMYFLNRKHWLREVDTPEVSLAEEMKERERPTYYQGDYHSLFFFFLGRDALGANFLLTVTFALSSILCWSSITPGRTDECVLVDERG